jgi:hypothetical protein
MELAVEGAKAKVRHDRERFMKIRALIVEHREKIEQEIVKLGTGRQPPPHIVINRLLELDKEFPTEKQVLELSAKKSPPKKSPVKKSPVKSLTQSPARNLRTSRQQQPN